MTRHRTEDSAQPMKRVESALSFVGCLQTYLSNDAELKDIYSILSYQLASNPGNGSNQTSFIHVACIKEPILHRKTKKHISYSYDDKDAPSHRDIQIYISVWYVPV
ncbi:unnamed protein product [Sphenostylis stenocarpa]|uniref:Uncharacterized protein n=1 Tax=Sphenostylis stenocarpa TaxID=92480 RepID=A0AA86W4T5_9FABA|nr:unnamed protein product [Sphenostylis stenocarpa]